MPYPEGVISTGRTLRPDLQQKSVVGVAETAGLDMSYRLLGTHVPVPVKIGHGDKGRPAESGIAVEINNMAGFKQLGQGFHRIG